MLLSQESASNSGQLVSTRSIVVAVEDQISSDVAGEAVILDLKAGMYFGLNSIGTRIWKLIQEPIPVERLRDLLLDEYDVEAERCETELIALLKSLASNKLIKVHNESVS